MSDRKKLFGDHIRSYVPIVALIKRVLDERPSHHAPASRFREQLEDHMSASYANRALLTAVNWGRYGELYSYNENSQIFSNRE